MEQEKNPVSPESNDIEVSNVRKEEAMQGPPDDSPDLGEERRADLTTAANQELEEAHENDPKDGGVATRLEQIADPAGSADEHMPAGSESAEDKVNDIINSGILRM